MLINWKVRIKSKQFWLTLVPALLLLVQAVLLPFGITVPTELIAAHALGIINAAFALLTILGLVNDPTVKGLSDSKQALRYDKPKDDDKYIG